MTVYVPVVCLVIVRLACLNKVTILSNCNPPPKKRVVFCGHWKQENQTLRPFYCQILSCITTSDENQPVLSTNSPSASWGNEGWSVPPWPAAFSLNISNFNLQPDTSQTPAIRFLLTRGAAVVHVGGFCEGGWTSLQKLIFLYLRSSCNVR